MPSSVIESYVYRPEARVLEVAFKTGRVYVYHDVPPLVAQALSAARSKGAFFNKRIRDRYRCTEADRPAENAPNLSQALLASRGERDAAD